MPFDPDPALQGLTTPILPSASRWSMKYLWVLPGGIALGMLAVWLHSPVILMATVGVAGCMVLFEK